jgi:DNA repair exonuclease SbcCD ATPase subunit
MQTKSVGLAVLVLLLVLRTSVGQQQSAPMAIRSRADVAQAMDQIQSDLAALNQHHQSYREAAEKLDGLYSNLSKKAEAVSKAARAVKPERPDPGAVSQLLAATQQMQETQMSFNLQYLQLQSQMQNENRAYTAVSNIMKTKHDTVKNSISNLR